LIALDLSWRLMDVPGRRELQLWNAPEALDHTFADVAAVAADCRFGDCRHQTEPGCAVRQALGDRRLDAARWGSFQAAAGDRSSGALGGSEFPGRA